MLIYAIFVPIVSSVACFIGGRLAGWTALIVSGITALIAASIFLGGEVFMPVLSLRAYPFSSGAFLAASLLTLLIMVYSLSFMTKEEASGKFYGWSLITLGASAGAFFANDYFTLLTFWGVLGAVLYMLVGLSGPNSSASAKKTFIMVGGADAVMILGVGIIWLLTRSIRIALFPITIDGYLPVLAFLCLAAGSFAKAGAIPLHSWIPDIAERSYVPALALLPASLDKLLGIYLLARVCLDIFIIVPNSPLSIMLLVIGSITIIVGVMAALVQHNLKKLLSFHAISQVGYMVLGIGTALPIGIAGGIFHMLNNAIYKSCLFLTAGAVEKETGTSELEKLGGLARFMPLTFTAAFVAAFSISGIPPLNGFFSKWMIYQSIVELSRTSNLWIIWLVAAMFGSALTLASFIKVIHAVFLGQWSEATAGIREVSPFMWAPMLILALLCVVFGIFAFTLPLKYFVLPSVGYVSYSGSWSPAFAALLLLLGLLIGLLIYFLGHSKKVTVKPAYIGGELIDEKAIKVSGVNFYDSIRDWGPINAIISSAEKKVFDVYEIFSNLAFSLNRLFSWLHNGMLETYLAWMLLGGIILILMVRF